MNIIFFPHQIIDISSQLCLHIGLYIHFRVYWCSKTFLKDSPSFKGTSPKHRIHDGACDKRTMNKFGPVIINKRTYILFMRDNTAWLWAATDILLMSCDVILQKLMVSFLRVLVGNYSSYYISVTTLARVLITVKH